MFQFPTASAPIFNFDSALFRSVPQDFGQPAPIAAELAGDFLVRDILQIKFPSLVTLFVSTQSLAKVDDDGLIGFTDLMLRVL